MSQMTWRAETELVERLRRAAERHHRSMNDYVTLVLDAATYPNFAGSDAEVVIAAIARVEVCAVLWRKQRTGELGAGDTAVLVAEIEADYFGTDAEEPRFAVVAISGHIFDLAARFAGVHGLRTRDSIQLACAVAARGAAPDCTELAAFDRLLRDAAAAEGFSLLPATIGAG